MLYSIPSNGPRVMATTWRRAAISHRARLIRCLSTPNGGQHTTDLDAIIVLAGGIRDDGSLPPWVHRRLDTAAALYQQQQQGACQVLCSGGGTPHRRTVLSPTGFIVFESTACAEYLMDHNGIASSAILKETASMDTVGNGYFSLTAHAVPGRWRNIAIVTSAFHMPRSRAIINTCCRLVAQDVWRDPAWYSLHFIEASDDGLFEDDVYAARLDKEAAAVKQWHHDTDKFTSLSELHAWLFATHMCYSVNRQNEFGRPTQLDPKLLASY